MKYFVIIILYISFFTPALAQRWGVELHTQKALVFRGAQAIARGNPQAIELRLLKATDGSAWWHRPHQYPRFGININYLDFNDPILGQSLSMQITGERNIFKRKRLQFNFVAGMGIAWITNPFDRQNNNKNIMLSGNLNSSWIANFSLAWQIKPPWQLMFEFGIIHYSNGAVQLPNQGINLATANVGIGYKPQVIPITNTFAEQKSSHKNILVGCQQHRLCRKISKQWIQISSIWITGIASTDVGKSYILASRPGRILQYLVI